MMYQIIKHSKLYEYIKNIIQSWTKKHMYLSNLLLCLLY